MNNKITDKPIAVRHAALIRLGDSALKSRCPFCVNGVLAMRRNENLELLPDDVCLLCGQQVYYVDFHKIEAI